MFMFNGKLSRVDYIFLQTEMHSGGAVLQWVNYGGVHGDTYMKGFPLLGTQLGTRCGQLGGWAMVSQYSPICPKSKLVPPFVLAGLDAPIV